MEISGKKVLQNFHLEHVKGNSIELRYEFCKFTLNLRVINCIYLVLYCSSCYLARRTRLPRAKQVKREPADGKAGSPELPSDADEEGKRKSAQKRK